MSTFSFVEPAKIGAARYLIAFEHEANVQVRFLGLIAGLVTQAQRTCRFCSYIARSASAISSRIDTGFHGSKRAVPKLKENL